MKGFFVTGTDTGVGKTIVSALLINVLRMQGLKTCAMKPLETGAIRKDDVLIPSDGMFLREMAQMEEPLNYVTPLSFERPLAPMVAAEMDGAEIDITLIGKAYEYLKKRYEAIVVEGIGGIMVPIKKDYLVIDLIKDFGLPALVVSRPGLGTINHTILTINELIRRNIPIGGIIFNYSAPPEGSLAEETNPSVLLRLTDVSVIGTVPYLKSFDSETLMNIAMKNLKLELLTTWI